MIDLSGILINYVIANQFYSRQGRIGEFETSYKM